jgi:hypothetical protein
MMRLHPIRARSVSETYEARGDVVCRFSDRRGLAFVRALACPHYDACVDTAAEAGWPSWSCKACLRLARRRANHLRRIGRDHATCVDCGAELGPTPGKNTRCSACKKIHRLSVCAVCQRRARIVNPDRVHANERRWYYRRLAADPAYNIRVHQRRFQDPEYKAKVRQWGLNRAARIQADPVALSRQRVMWAARQKRYLARKRLERLHGAA